jgi:pimeloyl-ACP methyl ester carboxylesterase
MALDLVGLLDALKIRRAHLVGASMGGTIAQTVALNHPERVLSLTSMMSTTGDRDLPQPKTWALSALMKPAPAALEAYAEHYLRTWRALRGGGFPEEDERDLARAIRNHTRGLNPAGAARQLAAILASGSRRQALRSVAVPTLVIHGDADPLVPLAAGYGYCGEHSPAQRSWSSKGWGTRCRCACGHESTMASCASRKPLPSSLRKAWRLR